MDRVWYRTVVTSVAGAADESMLVAALTPLLGDGAAVTVWQPGRESWLRTAGAEVPDVPDVPTAEGIDERGEDVLIRVGTDPTASRLVLLHCPAVERDDRVAVADLVRTAVGRLVERDIAADARQRLTDNERIGTLGSYDWHVPTDTNRWSDQLYRIYGEEPQSFNASYEKFLSFIHPDDREKVQAIHQRAFETGEPYEMEERIVLADGTERLLWSNGEVIMGPDGSPEHFIGICRDVTEQRAAERAAADAEHHRQQVHDAELRRRAALELNDSVVQGLIAAIWSADVGATHVVSEVLQATLESARSMMDDLLVAGGGAPIAGELQRATPARPHMGAAQVDAVLGAVAPAADAGPTAPPSGDRTAVAGRRVLVADDSEDVRLMLSVQLQLAGATVVGEASDGAEAIELAAAHTPDLVLLDLSMPGVDGLEATARIRAEHPDVSIIILSGYAAATMAERAREAGADGYIEKGGDVVARLEATMARVEA